MADLAERGWKRQFDNPIPLPRGRQLVTLEDAGNYIAKLPKAEQEPRNGSGVLRLVAARPDLPEKIINARARDKSSEKISTLFDYLFVPASGEAFGAEHYFAGYRVMRPEEIDLAVGALDASEVVVGAH